MEYVLYGTKKILTTTMYPVGATLILLIAGIALLLKGRKKVGMFFVAGSCIILLVFSMGWTGMALLKPLEDEAGPYGEPAKLRAAGVKYIVVLAGSSVQDQLSPADRWQGSILRLLEGIRLWSALPGTKPDDPGSITGPKGRHEEAISGSNRAGMLSVSNKTACHCRDSTSRIPQLAAMVSSIEPRPVRRAARSPVTESTQCAPSGSCPC